MALYCCLYPVLLFVPLTAQGVTATRFFVNKSGIILGMGSTNEGRRNKVTSSLIGWAHCQNEPFIYRHYTAWTSYKEKWKHTHYDVIKWKHFPRYWPFVGEGGADRPPVNSPHKGQWHGDLMFSLICAWTDGWVNNRDHGDLRRKHAHYDVTIMHICVMNINLIRHIHMSSRTGCSSWICSTGTQLDSPYLRSHSWSVSRSPGYTVNTVKSLI